MPKIHVTLEFESESEMLAYFNMPAPETESAVSDVTRDSLDKDGMPYDEAIHADPPQLTASGEWRAKRGQADVARAARAEFLASGGNVTPPSDLPPTDEPLLPNLGALPDSAPAPVSRDAVFAAISAALKANPTLDVLAIYREFCGTDDANHVLMVLESNETVRANIMRHIASL